MKTDNLLCALIAAAGLTIPAGAQNLVGYSIAAGTGSASGSAAGKQVSDGLNAVFAGVGKQLKKTGDVEFVPTPKPTPEQVRALGWDVSVPGASASSNPATVAFRPARLRPVPVPNGAKGAQQPEFGVPEMSDLTYSVITPVIEMPSRQAMAAALLASIPSGASRDELFRAAGLPTSRVTIPDGKSTREILYYPSGRVYVTDGAITDVRAR